LIYFPSFPTYKEIKTVTPPNLIDLLQNITQLTNFSPSKMPFFEIQHHIPLGPQQREQLAKAFTNLHATTFNAPSLFVNIRFINLDFNGDEDYFYGGERRPRTNRIFVHIRSGAGRNYEKYAEEIERLWDEIVGGGYKKMYKLEKEKEGIKDDRKEGERFKEEHIRLLQGVFIIPGLTAREEGFAIPQVSSFLLYGITELINFRPVKRRLGWRQIGRDLKRGLSMEMRTLLP
jgi:phenylpyruvate tautomerase PptA (4-oxalocrotonate tautomerase family)